MSEPKILVVEDEAIVAFDLRERLASVGYSVPAIAATAQEAIILAGEISPDLVLMDIKLRGEITGIEAAQAIRARYGIPVVYLTAYADEDTIQRAKLARPFGYLLKPFNDRELRAAIEIALYRFEVESHERKLADATLLDVVPTREWRQTAHTAKEKFPKESEPVIDMFRRLPRNSDKTPEEIAQSSWRLVLIPPGPKQPLCALEIVDDVRIGRGSAGIDVDLDLSIYGAEDLGVSRLHALLSPTENGLLLYDVGSTNGTTCNHARLWLGKPEALADGDLIGFGSLYFKVKLVGRP